MTGDNEIRSAHCWRTFLVAAIAPSAVAIVLALTLTKNPGRFWMDEQYSVLMTHQTFGRIVELCRIDAHPPGYYALLKVWMKLPRLAGCEPGPVWARSHGMAWWILGASLAVALCVRTFGRTAGVMLGWCLIPAPRILEICTGLRQYSVELPMFLLLFFLLVILHREDRRMHRLRIFALWILYGVLATLALWCHVLAAVPLLFLGLLWLALCDRRGMDAFGTLFFRVGLAAHLTALLLFLPWLAVLTGNLEHVREGERLWLTPATPGNFLRVFSLWYVYPFLVARAGAGSLLAIGLGALAVLVPLAGPLVRKLSVGDVGGRGRWAMAALGVCVATNAVFWILGRTGVAPVFHAPRYPTLVLGLFVTALVLAACSVKRTEGKRCLHPAVLLLPWFLVLLLGVVALAVSDRPSGPFRPPVEARELLPAEGGRLYVMHPELVPFVQPGYPGWDVRRIEDLASHPEDEGIAVILRFSFWSFLAFPRDIRIHDAIERGYLSERVDRFPFDEAEVIRLVGVDHDALHIAAEPPEGSISYGAVVGAVSEAAPQWQESSDGWFMEESEADGRPSRRAITSPAIARFNKPLPAGDYVLHLRGYHHPYPGPPLEFQFRFLGETERSTLVWNGWTIDLSVPITLAYDHEKPRLAVFHPVWKPEDHIEGSDDPRPFAFTYHDLWVERVP